MINVTIYFAILIILSNKIINEYEGEDKKYFNETGRKEI
jgi:hypothetical protein